jgi:hypothetical protein
MLDPMRPLIATFARTEQAKAFSSLLERSGIRCATAVAGAWDEPFDGHDLVAAWVPDDMEERARHGPFRAVGVSMKRRSPRSRHTTDKLV